MNYCRFVLACKVAVRLCPSQVFPHNSARHRVCALQNDCLYRQARFLSSVLPGSKKKNNFQKKQKQELLSRPVQFGSDDPDVFGSMSRQEPESEVVDEGDEKEREFLENPPTRAQQLRTKQYADMIKNLLRNNQVKEAIDVLEVRMVKEDRVKPENYIYNLLIGGCARAGYSKKAFQLFNRMKQRNLAVTGGTYTSLFNACANSPWITDGLAKANHLCDIMIEKGYEPNSTNYNAMIKAFGRCGDIKTCFQLVDMMQHNQMEIRVDTFNFLLQACASDEEYGFRHALLVWHKMLQRNLQPDIYSFNLILRCTRDCSIGDVETTEKLIKQILLQRHAKTVKPKQRLLDNGELVKPEIISLKEIKSANFTDLLPEQVDNTPISPSQSNEIILPTGQESMPNLLAINPTLGNLIKINEITEAADRLMLLGGANGFLHEIESSGQTPDIKTFTALLDTIPSTHTAEKQLLIAIRKKGIKVDIDFFNILIKKRSMRFDYDSAKEVLSMIKTAKLQPDIVTYGVLALGCKTQEEAKELLDKMYDSGVRMNVQILGAMMKQACYHKNFEYVLEIMNIAYDEQIKLNDQFIGHLLHFVKYCHNVVKQKHPTADGKSFRTNYTKFNKELELWKAKFNIDHMGLNQVIGTLEEHPYKQFREQDSEGFEETKNPKQRHKSKLKRYIRRINPDKLSDGPSSPAQSEQ